MKVQSTRYKGGSLRARAMNKYRISFSIVNVEMNCQHAQRKLEKFSLCGAGVLVASATGVGERLGCWKWSGVASS